MKMQYGRSTDRRICQLRNKQFLYTEISLTNNLRFFVTDRDDAVLATECPINKVSRLYKQNWVHKMCQKRMADALGM